MLRHPQRSRGIHRVVEGEERVDEKDGLGLDYGSQLLDEGV